MELPCYERMELVAGGGGHAQASSDLVFESGATLQDRPTSADEESVTRPPRRVSWSDEVQVELLRRGPGRPNSIIVNTTPGDSPVPDTEQFDCESIRYRIGDWLKARDEWPCQLPAAPAAGAAGGASRALAAAAAVLKWPGAVAAAVTGVLSLLLGLVVLSTLSSLASHTAGSDAARRGVAMRTLEVAAGVGVPSGVPECNASLGPFYFQNISVLDRAARLATQQLVHLTKALRSKCRPQAGLALGGDSDSLLAIGSTHDFLISWKYAEDCGSATYRVKVLPPGRGRGWSGAVNYDVASGRWMVLEDAFRPPLCELGGGGFGEGQPERVPDPIRDLEVVSAAAFAVQRLSLLRQRAGCGDGERIELSDVREASEQVSRYLGVAMHLLVNVSSASGWQLVQACLTVFTDYAASPPAMELTTGLFGEGRFAACDRPNDWGKAAQGLLESAAGRRLGHIDDAASDPTSRLVAWRRRLHGEPDGSEPPVALRHIRAGMVPTHHDLRYKASASRCLRVVGVEDQGRCGCCYAAALAQAMSLRRCLAEAREGRHSTAADLTYSVQDLATCACSARGPPGSSKPGGCLQRAGCSGGNIHSLWDAWMRHLPRGLRRAECQPLELRCLPGTGGGGRESCGPGDGGGNRSRGWDGRSCGCLPETLRPSALPRCAARADDCSTLPRPRMVFELASIRHGLTPRESVLNMQRHVLESGPIYSAIDVTRYFLHFFGHGAGKHGVIYVGDGERALGRHAVVIVGWGQTADQGSGQAFWIIRNSWSENWAMGGHGHVLAGRNVKGIELRAAAPMMGDYEDHSPPVCDWSFSAFTHETAQGSKPCGLSHELELRCSEAASVRVYWAEASSPLHNPAGERLVVASPAYRCPATTACRIAGRAVLQAGKGEEERALRVAVRAWDERGNAHTTFSSIIVPETKERARATGSCGRPHFACEGCSQEPPWEDPENVSDLLSSWHRSSGAAFAMREDEATGTHSQTSTGSSSGFWAGTLLFSTALCCGLLLFLWRSWNPSWPAWHDWQRQLVSLSNRSRKENVLVRGQCNEEAPRRGTAGGAGSAREARQSAEREAPEPQHRPPPPAAASKGGRPAAAEEGEARPQAQPPAPRPPLAAGPADEEALAAPQQSPGATAAAGAAVTTAVAAAMVPRTRSRSRSDTLDALAGLAAQCGPPPPEVQAPRPSCGWEYLDDADCWSPFGREDAAVLEAAFTRSPLGQQEVALGPLHWRYDVDFSLLSLRHLETGRVRSIRRTPTAVRLS